MAERHPLRPYQEECLDMAKEKNVIVSIPTGKGKTLIAARLIEHFLGLHPDKRIVFLVPTRALVDQQAEACEKQCLVIGAPPLILKMVGEAQSGWGQKDWRNALDGHHIFLGIPAVFQKAMVTDKFLTVEQFSVIVFDECHNATGNSPMASIMRDGVAPHWNTRTGPGCLPRILGLTASIIHGKLTDLAGKRRKLEALLNSTVVCPSISTDDESKYYTKVPYEIDADYRTSEEQVKTQLTETLEKTKRVKDINQAVNRCCHVFSELGYGALLFYVRHAIIQQIEAKAANLEQLENDANTARFAKKLRASLPSLRKDLDALAQKLSQTFGARDDLKQTPKLRVLLDLLKDIFARNVGYDGCRGIIFVEQIALVSALSNQISIFMGDTVECGAVTGGGAQTDASRQEQLEVFRSGSVNVLVATAALEEGLDVHECKFVIRFSAIATTKGHIQGAGRARHPNAELYYFENDPDHERCKESKMAAVARDRGLALSADQLNKAVTAMQVSVEKRHPYPFGSTNEGMVTVYNSKDVFARYCAKVLRKSIPPDEVYTYRLIDGHVQKKLVAVRYPTEDGWKSVKQADCLAFWKGVDLRKVFIAERSQKKSEAEKEEMRFIYLVIVHLREAGCLNSHNQASELVLAHAQERCPLRGQYPPECVTLKNGTFPFKTNEVEDAMAKKLVPNLAEGKSILNDYIGFVLGSTVSVKDNLIRYEITDGGQHSPIWIRFPTPRGWEFCWSVDFDETFGDMDLNDQIDSSKRKTERQLRELGFSWLAVTKLKEWGHLDDFYKPLVPTEAREKTRENCPLSASQEPEYTVPSDITVSDDSFIRVRDMDSGSMDMSL